MSETENLKAVPKTALKSVVQGEKLRGADKVARIPVKVIPTVDMPRKPDWIRVTLGNNEKVEKIRSILRKHKLSSVCEEASCPNLGECFSGGTATFMIMGDICTRRCPFCDVAHGRPNSLMENEPLELAEAIAEMGLKYVVVTSVDRDDLRDGGADHFARCIAETRRLNPDIRVEILVPDFRGRGEVAVDILTKTKPDVFNHNLETVQSLYKKVRPGSDYQWSLSLLKQYKQIAPDVLTKSGIMVGVGETKEEVIQVLKDMHAHDIDMVTIGQYLQPSRDHLPVERFVHPDEFDEYARIGEKMGFHHIASGPLIRSSYHADQQSKL
ncbi:MAG: lipoyl synthase [Gammaproteobacteria bacterium]|nr:lipoyl synthase [Gammaproteobacteria bacterium]